MTRVLYLIVCGSPAAAEAGILVDLAQADGWDVCVIATPYGTRFIDVPALEAKTGHPVRSEYKLPGQPDVLPPADAMIVAPATCNTVAKWAAGISDTLALGLVVEAVGAGKPVVCVPYSTPEQINFPAVQRAIRDLAAWGVKIVDAPLGKFPWNETWATLKSGIMIE
ncbi:flavoprotein [Pseudonocardiaceae bacterium YIM PH 21723]|nr:flavoprotein [Pseudonocardiaceae bacterium YIM PH 21723]